MKIPILTYHAMSVNGPDYEANDLIALATDLERITQDGWTVVRLCEAVEALRGGGDPWNGSKVVAMTCDDGSDFDYLDLPHPTWGTQSSVLNILRGHARLHPGRQPFLEMTSFVIASPQARQELDRTCMMGQGWWNEHWWRAAAESGFMAIASHSWDHNHESLEAPRFPDAAVGTFTSVDSLEEADYQIRQSVAYIREKAPNRGDVLLAYPYGEYSEYLVEDYLPRFAEEIGLRAAFTIEAGPMTRSSPIWKLPRFVFGRDWKDPDGLATVLRS